MNADYAQILNNEIFEMSGTHATGVSIFDSREILVANNFIGYSNGCLSFEDDTICVVHNNVIFHEEEKGGDLVRDNHNEHSGYFIFTNNTVLRSEKNVAISMTNSDLVNSSINFIVKNNIIDGWNNFALNCNTSHNLYTGLSWNQSSQYGWELMDQELIQENLSLIFTDPVNNDYSFFTDSEAVDKGTDLNIIIPQEIKNLFPDFDFTKDILGKSRDYGSTWDLGAYELNKSTNINDKTMYSKNFVLYPNPLIEKATLEYELSINSFINISIYNVIGSKINTIYDGLQSKGNHDAEINLTDYEQGLYYIKIKCNDEILVKKCIKIK
jgi:hypothetical protein